MLLSIVDVCCPMLLLDDTTNTAYILGSRPRPGLGLRLGGYKAELGLGSKSRPSPQP